MSWMARTAPLEPISSRQEFQRLAASNSRARHGALSMSYVPNVASGRSGVGFSIHRTVGNAVTRNRIRRRLRASLRNRDLIPGLYLFRARPEATAASYFDLTNDIEHMFRHLGLPTATNGVGT